MPLPTALVPNFLDIGGIQQMYDGFDSDFSL